MKYIKYLICTFIWLTASVCLADDLVPYSFPFTGKWNPTENPMLLDDYGLQDIQNLRKWGKHFRGVKGHSRINQTSLAAPSTVMNGFQFRKGNPVESHVFAQLNNNSVYSLYKSNNTAAVPNQDTFSSFLALSGSNTVNFSNAPDGSMVALDGTTNYIWGGNEARCASFINFDAVPVPPSPPSFFYDFTTQVNNTAVNANNIATLVADSSGNTSLYIGSIRPLQGVKFYIQTGNNTNATADVKQWTGTAWSSVSSLSDGTEILGPIINGHGTHKTMAQTGEISWSSTVSTSKLTVINNIALYYYKFTFTGMPSGVQVSFCTVDAPVQPIVDVWDGSERTIVSLTNFNTNVGYEDYTIGVLKRDYDPNNSLSYWNAYKHGLGGGPQDCIYLAFMEPMRGFIINIPDTNFRNVVSSSTMTVQYWNGSSWVNVTSLIDGTYWGTSFQ